jgi:hypothetical protein
MPPKIPVTRTSPPPRVSSQPDAALSGALAAKLRQDKDQMRAANRKRAEPHETAAADTCPDTGICDDSHPWQRAVEEDLRWLMSERIQFGQVDDPLKVARTYATRIAGALEIERAPLEDLLSEMLSIQGPRTAAWLLERIDTIECLPGLDQILNCDAMSFCVLVAEVASSSRAARDRGIPVTPIFAMPKSASSFVTETLRTLLDVPVGVTSVAHRLGMRPWISFIARFPISLHDHMYPTPGNLALLETAGVGRVALQIRDPSQLVISNIHHAVKVGGDQELLIKFRDAGPQAALDYMINRMIPGLRNWLLLWRASEIEVIELKFEDFFVNRYGFFRRLLDFFDVPVQYHSKISGVIDSMEIFARHEGQYNFRLGKLDEWRDVFSRRQLRMIEELSAGAFEKQYGI